MTLTLTNRLVESLPDAMRVRRLRNSCARFMTNARDPIGRWTQMRWYFGHYRAALREGRYRVYLFHEGRAALGYGALQLEDDQLLITECVAAEHRGRGVGTLILGELIDIARRESRDLVAEIWSSNEPSIGLHEKSGFGFEKTVPHQGAEFSVYRFRAESQP